MEQKDFVECVNDLSWSKSMKEQSDAIKQMQLINDEQIGMLFDKNRKDCWENMTLVLKNIGYPRNNPALPDMIWLFKDMNWPGVENATEILKNVEKEVLIPLIKKFLYAAFDEEDFIWIAGIKSLISEIKINEKEFEDRRILEILEHAEW